FVQVIENELRPADGERWDDDGAAPPQGPVDGSGDLLHRVDILVLPVSVCRFEDQIISLLERRRRLHHRILRSAQIAGKYDRGQAVADPDAGGAENMPRPAQVEGQELPQSVVLPKGHRPE